MVDLRVELHLPGLTIAADKIAVKLPGRRTQGGPFAIVSRASGLAIDTGLHTDPRTHVIGYRAHSGRPQLWYLRPSGAAGRVQIVSADNGYALDCDPDAEDPHPRMVVPSSDEAQHWMIEPTSDGIGHSIESTLTRRRLAFRDDAEESWMPYFSTAKGEWRVQWVISQPVGRSFS